MKQEYVIVKEGPNHGHFYAFSFGASNHVLADEDSPPEAGGLQALKKVFKNIHPVILAGSVWPKLQAMDKAMGGKRIVPVEDINPKLLPSEKGAQKFYVPLVTDYIWGSGIKQAEEQKGTTPTFGLRSPYKKDFVAEFKSKIPNEAKFWDKGDEEWIIDKAYEPVVLMLLHQHFFVDPAVTSEILHTAEEARLKTLYADRNKGKNDLTITTDKGWILIKTPYNPTFVKALKMLVPGSKWDPAEKVWRVKDNGPSGFPTVKDMASFIKGHYKKEPVIETAEAPLGDLIVEMLWMVAQPSA